MQEDDDLEDRAAAGGEQAEKAEPSEAETETPEGEEAEPETETEGADADEADGEETKDGDNADGEEDEGEGDEPKPKRASRSERYQRKISRLEQEVAELRSRQTSGSRSESDVAREVEKIVGPKPNEADFKGDYLAYERALTVYELDRRQAEREVKNQGTREQALWAERRRLAAEAHQERVEEFREKAKDFDQVLRSASDLKASPVVEDLILDSEKSAHLVYFLAKNPQRLHALNGMSEREAARELGRIESRLSLPQPKTKTQAPKPVTPPKGGAAPSSPDRELDAWLKKKYG